MKKISNQFMTVTGKFYEQIYRMPVLGDPLVRGITNSLGWAAFRLPFFKRCDSIAELRKMLTPILDRAGISIRIIDETPDSLSFAVPSCPYGYCRPDQKGVCDAAMDMDRRLFSLCGADLVIEETVVAGAPECRMVLKKR